MTGMDERTQGGCHPHCSLGPRADHPGYLGYRCITESGTPLPWPGERQDVEPCGLEFGDTYTCDLPKGHQ